MIHPEAALARRDVALDEHTVALRRQGMASVLVLAALGLVLL